MDNIVHEGVAAAWTPRSGVGVHRVAKARDTEEPVQAAQPKRYGVKKRTYSLDEYYAIEDNVPEPPPATGKKFKYPFELMEVGQSFLVEGKTQSSVTASIWAFNKSAAKRGEPAKEFTTRLVPGGVRVWRKK